MRYFRLFFAAIGFLIGVTTLILGGLYFYRKTEEKTITPKDRMTQPGNFIRLNAGITHYQLAGPDTAQTIVLIHSFTTPYYIWDSTFNYLVSNGYRVLRYDQYGCGFSDRPDSAYTKQLYFNQLSQLIKALKLATPVNLVGVSFGGMIATDFTAKYPNLVNKVVLIDPGYERLRPDKPEFVAKYYETIHPNERAESQLDNFKHPEHYPDWIKKYRSQMRYKGFIHALVSTMYNYDYDGSDSNTRLNAAHKPVLLIWGRDDRSVPYAFSDSIRSVLKTEFFPVDDAGHFSCIEQADLINPRILQFLEEGVVRD